uniref:LMBR1 domain-containing protein n=2 Tax=Photinus pyralis TaxID=7054 RepID=A0A1Y1L8F3_PHOPY
MTYTAIITKIILSFVLAASILYRYGNWFRHHIFVTLVVLLAWYFSFLIIFVLPLDVINTVYRQCTSAEHIIVNVSDVANLSIDGTLPCEEPWSHVPEKVFPNLWRTVYWSSQCLTWLLMPMMQSYIKAGDFTIKGKLKSAVIDNAIYYGSYLFICGILLIYLALKPGENLDWPKLKAIASSASNTWGLFLLVLLLGYALVEVPRGLWNNSNYMYVVNYAYFKAAKLSSDKCEAEETVDDVLESLQAISLSIRPGHALHHNLETILHKVPIELRDRMSRRQLPDDTPLDVPSEKSLIRLHKQVIKSLQVLQRTETQWNILVEKIFDLEDVLKNLTSMDRRFKPTFPKPKSTLVRYIYTPLAEWYWKCFFRCYVQKVLAVLAAILSVAVVWSEVTFFNKEPPLSIFAIIVSNLKYDYCTIEIMSTIVILYLCYCAYSTVLKIRVLNLYYLAPHHQTNEYSLIFSGMMLSRLTPPLCLNFLGLIHMDSHIIKKQMSETYYTQIMGHMDVIAIISDGFNVYFPIAILLFCLATYFSLGARLLSVIGFHQFVGDDEITTDLVDDGRELIKREKRKRERAEESSNRKHEFNQRYPVTSRYRIRNSTDTVRPVTRELVESTRSNLLKEGGNVESYEGTRFNSSDVDTSFPPDSNEDIGARFGVSTHKIINERFDSSEDLDPRFSDGYQSHNYKRVGPPPRGIFDDV